MRRHHKWAIAAAVITTITAIPVTSKIVNPTPISVATSTHCHINGVLPDKICTPGAIDPRVTQANIQSTICVKGYTATVRPPVSYTSQVKLQSYAEYGISPSTTAELDHLISLELGGAPTDPKNLWVEPGSIPNPKDKVENLLHQRVCSGQITLNDAQSTISNDWTQVK